MVINQKSICSGCNQVINDRYIFQVDNQKLHYNCLKCSSCKCPLNGKCWFKQNQFYCKDDYYRLIELISSCSVCKKLIEKNTFKHTIYNLNVHLNCFKCSECDKILNPGDQFVIIKNDKFVCSFHFNQKYLKDEDKPSETNYISKLVIQSNNIYPLIDQPAFNQENLTLDHHSHLTNHSTNQHNLSPNSMNLVNYSSPNLNDSESQPIESKAFRLYSQSYNSSIDKLPASSIIDNYWTPVSCNSPLNENENLTTQFLQNRKGRPKKKKYQIENIIDYKSECDINDLNLTIDTSLALQDINNLNNSNSSINFNHCLISSSSNVQIQNSNSSNSSSNSSISGHLRIKRNRTSFKAYQLRMMKDYFAINQNPDSKQLLQLSEQTGLSKRILQVWFQNSRANHRKKINVRSNQSEFGKYLFKRVN